MELFKFLKFKDLRSSIPNGMNRFIYVNAKLITDFIVEQCEDGVEIKLRYGDPVYPTEILISKVKSFEEANKVIETILFSTSHGLGNVIDMTSKFCL